MVLMAVDHTRHYFHFGALQGIDPSDLARTTPAVFFTRWITHYCAPAFSFLAGVGVSFSLAGGKTPQYLRGFLVTRGLWLIILDLTLFDWFGWAFEIKLFVYTLRCCGRWVGR